MKKKLPQRQRLHTLVTNGVTHNEGHFTLIAQGGVALYSTPFNTSSQLSAQSVCLPRERKGAQHAVPTDLVVRSRLPQTRDLITV